MVTLGSRGTISNFCFSKYPQGLSVAAVLYAIKGIQMKSRDFFGANGLRCGSGG